MSAFEVHGWTGSVRRFEFIGWRKDRRAAFILDKSDRRRAVQLKLPCPAGAQLVGNPIPDSAPLCISRARLIPPPCRASQEQAERVLLSAEGSFQAHPWERIYGEVLWLVPADDGPLLERLEIFKAACRVEYERRLEELRTLTFEEARHLVDGAGSVVPWNQDRFDAYCREQRENLELVYNAPARRLGKGGPAVAGLLQLTLQMVKSANAAGLRDRYLHERWAADNDFDLEQMSEDRERFLAWAQEHFANVVDDVYEANVRVRRRGLSLRLPPAAVSTLLASVRQCLEFADGSRCWLAAFEIRDLIDASEVAEFEACLSSSKASMVVSSAEACRQLGCKLSTLRNYCRTLEIDVNALTSLEIGRIRELRGSRTRRHHLRKVNRARHLRSVQLERRLGT